MVRVHSTPLVSRGTNRDRIAWAANEKLLTIGLRTSPAQLAVVNTETLAFELVNLAWTRHDGRPSMDVSKRTRHVRVVRRRGGPRRRRDRSSGRE